MTAPKFTFDRDAAVRAIRPFISGQHSDSEATPLVQLFEMSLLRDAITAPHGTSLYCEQSRSKGVERVRIVVLESQGDPPTGVTRIYDLSEIATGPQTPASIARAIEQLVDRANDMLPALHALKLGVDRIEHEIDYRNPKNLITLLESRDCTILDEQAVARLVTEEPGPLYYGDIDLGDDGADWFTGGGPWASRLESKLIELGAIERTEA